tara:strand:+ start:134117 stop:140011 length:5895 start_codon:yes stop_codon:yes gene_type:complete
MNETYESDPDGLDDVEKVAIVGLAGRYPGAPNIETFWQNLVDGVDSLHEFTDAELDQLGIPESVYNQPNFVRRGTILPEHDCFDHSLFGFSPREAAIIDPQSRVLLETAYTALEHAGYDPFTAPGDVGVFAGCNPVDYALLLGNADPTDSLTSFDQMIGNDRDFLATRIAHRLNLKGPAINVQSACSTSLVAVHLAAQHLLDYHCSMALAGGVSINLRQGVGYFYQPGMILSPDGKCRAFDRDANGTTLGQGAGMVVLKRLSDAIADNDTIHAVIAGSALNNDGAGKISYTAPSADGQAEVVATAHAVAGLRGDDITYIETHGTGTNLGDPVEIAGLSKAFRQTTDATGFCAIGSVKTNVGHTDAAAGITGFIKAVLAVREGLIPPSLHFTEPNEAIDFAKSPFYVADQLIQWKPTTTNLRRAGVSSFGIGGTNAHAIIEQAPEPLRDPSTTPVDPMQPHVIVVSASSSEAADASMAEAMKWNDEGRLGFNEVATLQCGRNHQAHRRSVVVTSKQTPDAESPAPLIRAGHASRDVATVWMFSGQGAQYPGMAVGLHGRLRVFTETIEQIFDLAQATAQLDLRSLLLADRADSQAAACLQQTSVTQPALFAMQHAMARQLEHWGVKPRAVLGHSIGEFAAAVTAGIIDWQQALRVVIERGRLMQSMVPGIMVAARLNADKFRNLLPAGVEIASANSTAASVAAGPAELMEGLIQQLISEGIDYQRLVTSHAFHTVSMAPAAAEFERFLSDINLSSPSIPMLSNVSGDWMSDDQAVEARFWASQIRKTVRFDECLQKLSDANDVLVEVGPGRTLSAFSSNHDSFQQRPTTVVCVGHAKEKRSADLVALDAVSRLWTHGIEIDWTAVNTGNTWQRVPAPRSVLQRTRHWAPVAQHVLALGHSSDDAGHGQRAPAAPKKQQREPLDRWCYARSWRRSSESPSPVALQSSTTSQSMGRVLLLTNGSNVAREFQSQLDKLADELIVAHLDIKTQVTGNEIRLEACDDDGFKSLLNQLEEQERTPDRVIHLWSVQDSYTPINLETLRTDLAGGTETLLTVARSLASVSASRDIQFDVIATGAYDVLGGESVNPSAASMAGPVKVIPLEYGGIECRLTDIPFGASDELISRAVSSIISPPGDQPVVAIRGRHRWVHDVEVQPLPPSDESALPIRRGGTYLIIGGLGGVGLSIAKHLATKFAARIALTSRSGRPSPDPSNPETTRRLERLREIETASEELLILSGDVTSVDDMRRVINTVEQQLGDIDGVVVGAAVADNAGAIHRRTREAAEAAISAKVHGSVVLSEVLPDRELDFVLLSSSIASQLYHNRFGQVGYVTSNSFAEGMSDAKAFNARRVVTMAWDDWIDIGMSVRAAQNFRQNHGSEIELMDEVHSFAPEDGIQLFERALVSNEPTLFVSTTDLRKRVAEDLFVTSPFLEQALASDDESDGGGVDGASIDETVMDVWRSLLGIDQIAPTDDFFELGGDSLQVARMADRLRRHLGTNIPLDLVFDNPTPQSLTTAIENLAKKSGTQQQLLPILGPQAAIPAQRRFLERESASPGHFNISALLRPLQPISDVEFQNAAEHLVQTHDGLRTSLRRAPENDDSTQSEWVQVVHADGDQTTVIEVIDLSGPNETRTVEELGQQWQTQFDIERGPLARFSLIRLPNDQQRIFLGLHHLISDRLSLLTLIDSLDVLLDEGSADALGNSTAPFSRWGAALQRYIESDQAAKDQSKWDSVVWDEQEKWPSGATGDTAATNINRNAESIKVQFDGEISSAMLRGQEGRVDEIILLALSDALRNWTGNTTMGIDVLGHGRRNLTDIDVARTVGFFLSYSPVWFTNEEASQELASRVSKLREDMDRAWTFDPLRYGRPSPGTTRPRPRVLFNFVGRPIAGDEPKRIVVVDEPIGSGTHPDNPREHTLSVMVEVSAADQVDVTLVYDSILYGQADIERLEQSLRAAIDQLCKPFANV